MLMVVMTMTSCSDTFDAIFGGDGIEEGETVMFTTLVPDIPTTRTAREEWNKKVAAYKAVNHEYTFKVDMYRSGDDDPLASSFYMPEQTTNIGSAPISSYDGTLEHKGLAADDTPLPAPLYWQDNNQDYGFKATSVSSDAVEADQNSQKKWLYQDKLIGHSYLPIWTGDDNAGSGTDPDVIQYKTNKQWYADNKTAKDQSGLMVNSNEDYKKIPLYLKHQRSWLTVILRAGEGVKREALQYSTSAENIKMIINSFAAGQSEPFEITSPWAREELINYDKDKNGDAANNVSTTRYDAIVEPHNYATRKEEEVIAKVNLSNQNFTFYAGNDERYLSGHTDEEITAANNAYNLEAGKHLTIEVTLSRESRKILITAWIEDWTEVATTTICDDYGSNGDPIVIKNKSELIAFLSDPKKNKEGSTGIVQPIELDLDGNGDWLTTYPLNATLNLAGCVLKTKHQLFTEMTPSANLVNGTIEMQNGASVACAVAKNNFGTIERVNLTTTGNYGTAKATVAGMVEKNCGTIYQCTSTLPVYATTPTTIIGKSDSEQYEGYIGGIAAVSVSPDGSSMAVIDRCTVNASVNSSNDNIHGGGIVGIANGRVSNNTYEYGITLSQPSERYKNIFAQVASGDLRAYANSWPTTALNPIGSESGSNQNEYTKTKYDAVIDCQAELHELMQSAYNITGRNYRISKDFTVASTNNSGTDWLHGTVNDDYAAGINNVSFNLDGNDKTITLTGTKKVKTTTGINLSEGTVTEYTTAPMLFNYVLGEIKNLNIYLDKPLVASPTEGTTEIDGTKTTTYNAADAIAPLAYAVYGENGKLTNVSVKGAEEGVFVQSSTPAGLVVWAYGGATISNCKVNVPVRLWLPESMGTDAKHYAGGLVACVATVSILNSKYLVNSETALTGAETSSSAIKSPNYYYGGIVGGTTIKKSDKPQLQIADCSSWYIATHSSVGSPDQSSKGAIIGTTCYADNDASHTTTNGMSSIKISEGNWWPTSAIGANAWATGLNEEKVIGKKNGVEPDRD